MTAKHLIFAMIAVALFQSPTATAASYGDLVERLPRNTLLKLVEANTPNHIGAIGRNKNAYFHVRFQRGMHHIADYGLATKRIDAIDRFLTAAEYSFNAQLPSGNFKLVIPPTHKNLGTPSTTDQASGVAFFASSIGLGLYALETNTWFKQAPECTPLRQRLEALKPKLETTLTYLIQHQAYLEKADQLAPNRLLFNALAYLTLGKISNHPQAIEISASFIKKALAQVHQQEGYFIEGGGYDSSYNAVATALAIRLLMLGHQKHALKSICEKSITWQRTRILATGEVSTAGNTRVTSEASGESFLGRKKDVDVGHVVEAFMLASQALSKNSYNQLALKVIHHYENARK